MCVPSSKVSSSLILTHLPQRERKSVCNTLILEKTKYLDILRIDEYKKLFYFVTDHLWLGSNICCTFS